MFETQATLHLEQGSTLHGQTRDLSQSGVFFVLDQVPAGIAPQQQAEIVFTMKRNYLSFEKKIPCLIKRITDEGLGLKFQKELIFDWLDMA